MSEIINPWKVVDKKSVYDNAWINVTEYNVINPGGGNGIYGKVHFKNVAVGIVALDENENIYLVGQYRFVLDAYSWEIPEGGCAEGENHIEAAKRELLEEAGLIAETWEEILRSHTSNSICDELAIIYLATNLKQDQPSPEETEDIKIKKSHFLKRFQWLIMEQLQIL